MSELAGISPKPQEAADTPTRRLLARLLQPAVLGLALGLLAAALLGNWFYRQAAEELVDEQQSRIAMLEGSALAAIQVVVQIAYNQFL